MRKLIASFLVAFITTCAGFTAGYLHGKRMADKWYAYTCQPRTTTYKYKIESRDIDIRKWGER